MEKTWDEILKDIKKYGHCSRVTCVKPKEKFFILKNETPGIESVTITLNHTKKEFFYSV